jgi:hypothetical protein
MLPFAHTLNVPVYKFNEGIIVVKFESDKFISQFLKTE